MLALRLATSLRGAALRGCAARRLVAPAASALSRPRCAWSGREQERRRAPDGVLYTLDEFREYYGGGSDADGVAYEHWEGAKHWDHKLTKLIAAAPNERELLGLHEQWRGGFNDIHVATTWHHLGKLRRRAKGRREPPSRLEPLREDTLKMLPQLRARSVASTAYGLACAVGASRPPWTELWAGLGAAGQELAGDMEPQNLSNTAWAFATARHAAPALLDALAAEAAPQLGEFNPQNLSNTAWAFATAQHAAPSLFGVGSPFAAACADASFNSVDLRQLHQWQQWRDDTCRSLSAAEQWPPLPAALRERCAEAVGAAACAPLKVK